MLHCSFARLHGNQLGKDDKNTTTTVECHILGQGDRQWSLGHLGLPAHKRVIFLWQARAGQTDGAKHCPPSIKLPKKMALDGTQLCWLLFRHEVCVCAVNVCVLPHSINTTATHVYWRFVSPREKNQACRLSPKWHETLSRNRINIEHWAALNWSFG